MTKVSIQSKGALGSRLGPWMRALREGTFPYDACLPPEGCVRSYMSVVSTFSLFYTGKKHGGHVFISVWESAANDRDNCYYSSSYLCQWFTDFENNHDRPRFCQMPFPNGNGTRSTYPVAAFILLLPGIWRFGARQATGSVKAYLYLLF